MVLVYSKRNVWRARRFQITADSAHVRSQITLAGADARVRIVPVPICTLSLCLLIQLLHHRPVQIMALLRAHVDTLYICWWSSIRYSAVFYRLSIIDLLLACISPCLVDSLHRGSQYRLYLQDALFKKKMVLTQIRSLRLPVHNSDIVLNSYILAPFWASRINIIVRFLYFDWYVSNFEIQDPLPPQRYGPTQSAGPRHMRGVPRLG